MKRIIRQTLFILGIGCAFLPLLSMAQHENCRSEQEGILTVSELPKVMLIKTNNDKHLTQCNYEGTKRCLRWQRVCYGPRSCLRSIAGSSECYLCSRYTNVRGRSTAIGRLVTCDLAWKNRAEARGWACVPRNNPREAENSSQHCVTWKQDCRWVCVR